MLGYFGIYSGRQAARLLGEASKPRRRIWAFGRLPHEIGALNAR